MRLKLVEEIEAKGVTDNAVLTAIANVPRHYFFEKTFINKAYENIAFPIGEDQTISQPYTVAYQSQLLEVQEGDKVLEIGTGSGYQASILAEMGANVTTIERNKNLYLKAKNLLLQMGYIPKIFLIFGDGFQGAPKLAPFDKILITAAAPQIPQSLIDQLKIGGTMVAPVVAEGESYQNMLKITKISHDEWLEETYGRFRFVPMLKGKVY